MTEKTPCVEYPEAQAALLFYCWQTGDSIDRVYALRAGRIFSASAAGRECVRPKKMKSRDAP